MFALEEGVFFKRNKPISFEAIRTALASVSDPIAHRDLLSLGAVKQLQIKDGLVKFEVESQATGPQADALRTTCVRAVEAVDGVQAVEVVVRPKQMPQGAPQAAPKPASPHAPGRIVLPNIKHVIAVASGKGGVGKSTVTTNLAVALAQGGAKVGLLDADIYGPSIPLMLGAKEAQPESLGENRIKPIERGGIKLMSMGFLVPEDKPLIWRGPMVHGALTQFLTQVQWGDLDYLLIDMPPGTGDAQLTISQSAPLAGAIIVTTPQEVSLIDARKGLGMFQNVNVPILGIVENMSGFVCPKCEDVTYIFKKGGGEAIAKAMNAPLLGSIPLDPRVVEGGDEGDPVVHKYPDAAVSKIYREMANSVAAQLAGLADSTFKPQSLEWK